MSQGADGQQVDCSLDLCIQHQVVCHHLLAQRAVLGDRIEVLGEVVHAVGHVNRANGPLQEQAPHVWKEPQAGNDGDSIRYTEGLVEAGIEWPVGSKGGSGDNPLACTVHWLYKTALIHRRAPWRIKEDCGVHDHGMGVMLQPLSAARIHRLHTPAEVKANYYRALL